jgi:hypothetical protein
MGWFNSVIDSVGGAVNWVKYNSGTIAQAASAIATVVRAVGVASDEDNDNDPANALFPNFNAAAGKLSAVATVGAKQQYKKARASLPAHIKNNPTLKVTAAPISSEPSFLWFDPAPVDSKGQPNRGLVRDIGKMLTQRSFPTILPSRSDPADIDAVGFQWFDVGLKIGQAILGTSEHPLPPPPSRPAPPPPTTVSSSPPSSRSPARTARASSRAATPTTAFRWDRRARTRLGMLVW